MSPLFIGPLLIDPPVLQAPMAGFTNYAYRQMIRRFGGVGLPATEMVSARGFLHIDARDGRFPDRLWGVADEPRPLAVQIWDNDPDSLAAVGQRLAEEFRVSVVDINFGCPVRDVSVKAESGWGASGGRVGGRGRVGTASGDTDTASGRRRGTRTDYGCLGHIQRCLDVHGRFASPNSPKRFPLEIGPLLPLQYVK